VVCLDIQGVGKLQSQDQGLGILKHLKLVSPAQIIVAYSNADFSLRYKEFFDLADHVLPKEADYVDFKRAVDGLLTSRFSLGFYLDHVARLASPYGIDGKRLRAAATEAIRSSDRTAIDKLLRQGGASDDAIEMIGNVLKLAIKIGAAVL